MKDLWNITTLEFDFRTLPKLLYLRISNFKSLKSIPSTLKYLPSSLRTMYLTDLNATTLPTWISADWIQLSRLFLERISLRGFPLGLLNLKNLEKLSLNGNPNVRTLPTDFGSRLPKLEVLSLVDMNLTSLPESIGKLNLKELNLGHNAIDSIESMGGITIEDIVKWKSNAKYFIHMTGSPICTRYYDELSNHPDACSKECSKGCSDRILYDFRCDVECNFKVCNNFDSGTCSRNF